MTSELSALTNEKRCIGVILQQGVVTLHCGGLCNAGIALHEGFILQDACCNACSPITVY